MSPKKVFNYDSFKLADGTFVGVIRNEESVEFIVQSDNKKMNVEISGSEAAAMFDGLTTVSATNRAHTETQILAEQVRYGMSRLRHPSNRSQGQP